MTIETLTIETLSGGLIAAIAAVVIAGLAWLLYCIGYNAGWRDYDSHIADLEKEAKLSTPAHGFRPPDA